MTAKYDTAFEFAQKGLEALDSQNNVDGKKNLEIAVGHFIEAYEMDKDPNNRIILAKKILNFMQTIQDLCEKTKMSPDPNCVTNLTSFHVRIVLEYDENGAIYGPAMLKNYYLSATWWCMHASKHHDKFKITAHQCLNRVEFFKSLEETTSPSQQMQTPTRVSSTSTIDRKLSSVSGLSSYLDELPLPPTTNARSLSRSMKSNAVSTASAVVVSPSSSNADNTSFKTNHEKSYTRQEKDVIIRSSKINGKFFLTWDDSKEKFERFNYTKPFIDPDGPLELSKSQKGEFLEYRRFCDATGVNLKKLCVFSGLPNPDSITQKHITDCSFVSSLCILATYERRWKRKLISKVIFPQSGNGEPCYNPSGKYMVKLWFNGAPRKIVVDDQFPVDREGRLMCSFCKDSQSETLVTDLWVSIIEKAYMKLNGGYDFPGSNSAIDIYALTGWIPENLQLELNPSIPSNNSNNNNYDNNNDDDDDGDRVLAHNLVSENPSDRVWNYLIGGFKYGDNLITVATGEISQKDTQNYGLVSLHAYAVLEMREHRGCRLLLVKNPWGRQRWTGAYSPLDSSRWTSDLKSALNYDPAAALKADDGTFWIDYESLLKYFSGMYVNWNLGLLPYVTRYHETLRADEGPENDERNFGHNPQFDLTLPADANESIIWLVLSRHVTDKSLILGDDALYMTLHVFSKQGGRRVYYPQSVLKRGSYSNNPNVVTSMVLPASEETTHYTVVVSVFKRQRDIDFTLTGYCTRPLEFKLIPMNLGMEKLLKGSWDNDTAGGNRGHASFYTNPQWLLNIQQQPTNIRLRLIGPMETPVNVRLVKGGSGDRIPYFKPEDEVATSSEYRSGFCYCETQQALNPGMYVIIASTFAPGQLGVFHLYVEYEVNHIVEISEIKPEGFGMIRKVLRGGWNEKNGNGVGSQTVNAFRSNPRFILTVNQKEGPVIVFVRLRSDKPGIKIGLGLFSQELSSRMPDGAIQITPHSNHPYGVRIEKTKLSPGIYEIVAFTQVPHTGDFELLLYSSREVEILAGI